MGADGGSIPKRDELVKTKQKQQKPDAAIQQYTLWNFCALSKEPLAEPIVCCLLGRMYNKQAILEYLINKSHYGDADILVGHIRSLKDVVELKLVENKLDSTETRFCCPLTQKEMNGTSKFVANLACGCVYSMNALEQISGKLDGQLQCLVCAKEYRNDELCVLNPTSPSDISVAEERVAKRLKETAERRKSKKAAKQKQVSEALDPNATPKERKNDLKRPSADSKEIHSDETKKRQKNINMALPDLSSFQSQSQPKSNVINSLYVKKDKDGKPIENHANFLVRGTFNRFAAGS